MEKPQSLKGANHLVSVIIPCHSSARNSAAVGEEVWYTVSSTISALEETQLEYEVIIILNGEYPITASLMHDARGVKTVFAGPQYNSPQAARHLGVQQSSGDPIFFLDAHVVVPPNFFRQIVADMEEVGADFMGTPHRFLGETWYGCHVAWDEYLWGNRTLQVPPLGPGKLFQAAIHPHGAFAMRRASYEKA
ncbi:MAG: glycosyltransferase, partial [Candidatus Sulfotelmatobacter sp.]